MNAHTSILIAGVLLAITAAASGQSPANDDFANRTVLSGSSLVATGAVAGATMENGEPTATCTTLLAGGSVWWTWTAPASTTVVISVQRESYSGDPYGTSLGVFTGTTVSNLTRIDCTPIDDMPGRYLKFAAVGGTDYHLQALGTLAGSFSFRLTATNPPVIVIPPQSATVSPYGYAFFSVLAAGIPPASLQWTHNGTPIPSATNVMLTVTNVTAALGGNYSVIASNAGGVTESVATLTVNDTDPAPRVTNVALNSAGISLAFSGESGRWYKTEPSSNLVTWPGYPFPIYQPASNSLNVVSIPLLNITNRQQFARVSLHTPAEQCAAQMKQILTAFRWYCVENHERVGGPFSFQDVQKYIPGGKLTFCPELGSYTVASVSNYTCVCSIAGRGHLITP